MSAMPVKRMLMSLPLTWSFLQAVLAVNSTRDQSELSSHQDVGDRNPVWTAMKGVLVPPSVPADMLGGAYETYIPILDQHQTRNCDRLDFVAADMHWISLAWSEGISRHLVCF
jgi:hypothetical protein